VVLWQPRSRGHIWSGLERYMSNWKLTWRDCSPKSNNRKTAIPKRGQDHPAKYRKTKRLPLRKYPYGG
jgi:hypothetical protein